MVDAALGELPAGGGEGRLVAIEEHRADAVGDQRLHRRPADALGPAGHHRHPAVARRLLRFHALVLLDNHPTQPGGRGVGFEYVSVEEAIGRDGLRMVVVGGVPSPWGEAAKGLFHIEGIDWVGVRLAYDSEALLQWAGERSGPVAVYGKEAPRPGWREILLLAERLAPAPRLLPAGPRSTRAGAVAGRHDLRQGRPQLDPPAAAGACRPAGSARLQRPRLDLPGEEVRPRPEEDGAAAGAKVAEMLGALAVRLKAQHAARQRLLHRRRR